MATGNINTARLVPWAVCWLNPKKKIRAGTITIPPPTPKEPPTEPANRPMPNKIRTSLKFIILEIKA